MAVTGAEVLLAAGLALSLGLNLSNLAAIRRLGRGRRRPPSLLADNVPPNHTAVQRLGLVRFSSYNDTGGDYSFALALLDPEGNGVVMSALYHRERCRVYAKPVARYESSYVLTDEEVEAIDRARTPGLDTDAPRH